MDETHEVDTVLIYPDLVPQLEAQLIVLVDLQLGQSVRLAWRKGKEHGKSLLFPSPTLHSCKLFLLLTLSFPFCMNGVHMSEIGQRRQMYDYLRANGRHWRNQTRRETGSSFGLQGGGRL
jgi:hypothetical protein